MWRERSAAAFFFVIADVYSESLCELISAANVKRIFVSEPNEDSIIDSFEHLCLALDCFRHIFSGKMSRCLAALYDCSLSVFLTECRSSIYLGHIILSAYVNYLLLAWLRPVRTLNAYISRCSLVARLRYCEIFNDRSIADCKTHRQCASERIFLNRPIFSDDKNSLPYWLKVRKFAN